MEYTIFQTTYTDRRTGEQRKSDTYHIRFRDHMNRRQTIAGSTREADTHGLAGKIGELVRIRQSGETVPLKLARWLASQPDTRRQRLEAMELIDPESAAAECPLIDQLDGVKDEADASKIIAPGYKQALAARGNTDAHVKLTTDRVRRVMDGCGFVYWRDLVKPGASTRVEVFLGDKRASEEFSGATYNYHIRELKGFCRWMHSTGRAPAVAMEALGKVKNIEADSARRRPLSIDEMRLLLQETVNGPDRNGLTGEERAILYRFAFETGMRTGQIRALKVKDFNLGVDPPTVTTQAKYVKRRRVHVQAIRPDLAGKLRSMFATRMPDSAAFKVPLFHNADTIRLDLAAARKVWIEAAKGDEEREQRQRSDFLADVNHAGERAVFYSMRHGHGTALAEAGVPEKDVARSLHHASRATTARYYLHTNTQTMAKAVATLPDLSYPQRQLATGTDGKAEDDCLCNACPTALIPIESSRQSGLLSIADSGSKTQEVAVLACSPRGGTADASDLKSDSQANANTANKALSDSMPPRLLNACSHDHQLAELVAAWPTLPADLRDSILKLMRAGQKGKRRNAKAPQARAPQIRLG